MASIKERISLFYKSATRPIGHACVHCREIDSVRSRLDRRRRMRSHSQSASSQPKNKMGAIHIIIVKDYLTCH